MFCFEIMIDDSTENEWNGEAEEEKGYIYEKKKE